MAEDFSPVKRPGQLQPADLDDVALVQGVKAIADALTFEDPITGPKTLADLAAAGAGISPELEQAIAQNGNTGVLSGLATTINGGTPAQFDVTAGEVNVYNSYTDPSMPELDPVSYAGVVGGVRTTGGESPEATLTYLAIDSAGMLAQFADTFTVDEFRDNAFFAILWHPDGDGSDIEAITPFGATAQGIAHDLVNFRSIFGELRISGLLYTSNGANKSLNRTLGTLNGLGTDGFNSAAARKSPSQTDKPAVTLANIFRTYRDATNGLITDGTATIWDPAVWDDGSGVLQAFPAADNYGVARGYFGVDGTVVLGVPQKTYETKAEADDDRNHVIEERGFLTTATPTTWCVFKKDATDFSIVAQAEFFPIPTLFRMGAGGLPDTSAEMDAHIADMDNPHGITGNEALITGIISGGVITINGGDSALFDVAVGEAVIVNWSSGSPVRTLVPFGPFIGESVVLVDQFTIPMVNAAGALVKVSGAIPTPQQTRQLGRLQAVLHVDQIAISDISTDRGLAYESSAAILDYIRALGTSNTGNRAVAAATDLTLGKTDGVSTRPYINVMVDPQAPATIASGAVAAFGTIPYIYRDGVGGFIVDQSNVEIDPNIFDDGTGVLTTNPNIFANQRFCFFAETNTISLIVPQTAYLTLQDALNGLSNETVVAPPVVDTFGVTTTIITIRKTATDLTDTSKVVFTNIGLGGAAGAGAGLASYLGLTDTTDADYTAKATRVPMVDGGEATMTLTALDHATHLANVGTNTHAAIDSHIANADAHHTEDHASRHSDGGLDEVDVEDLAATSTNALFVLSPDGTGGVVARALSDVQSFTFGQPYVVSDYASGQAFRWPHDAKIQELRLLALEPITSGTITFRVLNGDDPDDLPGMTSVGTITLTTGNLQTRLLDLTGAPVAVSAGDFMFAGITVVTSLVQPSTGKQGNIMLQVIYTKDGS